MTKLSSLPLRPSTLSVLNRRGFSYFADVETSKSAQLGGSLSNFATELEIPLAQAANIAREVDAVLQSYSPRLGPLSPTFASKPIDSQSSNNTNVAKDSNQVHVDTRTSKLTAASLLSSSQSSTHRPIISFVQAIDAMLGGGFNPHEVTEVVGLPGVGKTQLAMQLCVDATIPHVFGGVEGESVYIDSEGSFSPERVCGMAGELVSHLQSSARKRSVHDMSRNESRRKVLPDWFTVDSVMESIHIMRVLDEACQAATIFSLPTFLKKRKEAGKQVKMVVIDSIAFHYRCSSADYQTRTKSLATIAAFLNDLARTFHVAVVVVNQMTTKVSNANTNANNTVGSVQRKGSNVTNEIKFVPALGESWAHATTTRLLLMFDHTHERLNFQTHGQGKSSTRRICKLVKSPHKAAATAFYHVTERGLRDYVQ